MLRHLPTSELRALLARAIARAGQQDPLARLLRREIQRRAWDRRQSRQAGRAGPRGGNAPGPHDESR